MNSTHESRKARKSAGNQGLQPLSYCCFRPCKTVNNKEQSGGQYKDKARSTRDDVPVFYEMGVALHKAGRHWHAGVENEHKDIHNIQEKRHKMHQYEYPGNYGR